jgi:hypothetical protein
MGRFSALNLLGDGLMNNLGKDLLFFSKKDKNPTFHGIRETHNLI